MAAAADDVIAAPADPVGADRHAPAATAAEPSSPASPAAGTAIDRLRAELGVDDDREADWQRGDTSESSEPAAGTPFAPMALRKDHDPVEELAAKLAPQAGEAQGPPAAGPGPARRIAAPQAAELQEEVEELLDDVAVTIGRVVSIRGSVVWGALFDDDDGTTARAARMGALVSMRGPDSRVFGIVNALQRDGSSGGNQAERTIFEIQVLGEISTVTPGDRGGFQRGVSSYPPLDAPVTTVTLRDLATVYARPRISNVHIGRLRHNHKVPAFVLTDSLLGKHFAVLGTTGAGKSCAVTVILRSILDEHAATATSSCSTRTTSTPAPSPTAPSCSTPPTCSCRTGC